MTVNEFVEKYNDSKNKEEYLRSVCKTEYVPFETKVADCNRILKSTSYTNTEPNMYKQNSSSRKMLFLLTLIERYLDVDIDYTNALEEYNKLCMISMDRIFDSFNDELPASTRVDIGRYEDILYDMESDLRENERSIIGYLDSKFASLGIIGEALNKMLEENIVNNLEDN